MRHFLNLLNHHFLNDHLGKPGLGLFGIGTLLNVIRDNTRHDDILFYATLYSLLAGGSYYVIKIIFTFIKKDKE